MRFKKKKTIFDRNPVSKNTLDYVTFQEQAFYYQKQIKNVLDERQLKKRTGDAQIDKNNLCQHINSFLHEVMHKIYIYLQPKICQNSIFELKKIIFHSI